MAICIDVTSTALPEFAFEEDLRQKDAQQGAGKKQSSFYHSQHQVVCRHWLRNLCMKGEQQCPYLHYYDPNRMPECQTWLRFGKCSDPDCIYRHTKDENRPDCESYKYGFCKLGNACRLRHEKRPRKELPEVVSDYFLECIIAENVHLIPKLELKPSAYEDPASLPAVQNLPEPKDGKIKFVFIKSGSRANLDLSIAKAVWATTPGNSDYLERTFCHFDHVILIMTCKESKKILGYAKMLSVTDKDLFQGIWGAALSAKLANNFRVHWLKFCTLGYEALDYMRMTDPNVGVVPFYKFRDGMTLTDDIGEQICRQLTALPDVDLLQGTDFGNEPRIVYEPAEWLVRRKELLMAGDGLAPGAGVALAGGQEREVERAGTFEKEATTTATTSGGVTIGSGTAAGSGAGTAASGSGGNTSGAAATSGGGKPPSTRDQLLDSNFKPPGGENAGKNGGGKGKNDNPASNGGAWRPLGGAPPAGGPTPATHPPPPQQPGAVPAQPPSSAGGGAWRPPGAPIPVNPATHHPPTMNQAQRPLPYGPGAVVGGPPPPHGHYGPAFGQKGPPPGGKKGGVWQPPGALPLVGGKPPFGGKPGTDIDISSFVPGGKPLPPGMKKGVPFGHGPGGPTPGAPASNVWVPPS
eukprot:g15737.t1